MNKLAPQSIIKLCEETKTVRKAWIANDINDNYWEIAKSSYSVDVNKYTPKQHLTKVIFKKKICPNGYLTDSLYSHLLIDIKQCLINIYDNGSISKPYRLSSICNNIIYLIISVNEHRSDIGLPPILSLSQITEDDVFDFIKSFDISAELFFAVVDEVLALPHTPRAKDWATIQAKFSIKSKTFSIIKNRIKNSKNSVLYISGQSIDKKYDDANVKRTIGEMYLPNKKTLQNYISDINHLFTNSQGLTNPIKFSPYELIGGDEGLASIFNEFQCEVKTSIIPLEVAFHLVAQALKFQFTYGIHLLSYLTVVDVHYRKNTADLMEYKYLRNCDYRETLFHEVSIPEELEALRIKTLGLEKEENPEDGISLTQAINLYIASIYILLAAFSATRELSILLLKRDCFEISILDGLCDLVFKQQKSSTHNLLQAIRRPIPKPIYKLGLQYCEFSQYLENRFGIFHGDHDSYLFTNFHAIKKIITRHFNCQESELIPSHLHSDKMQELLNFFSDWSNVPLIDGKRWYVNDHQFRRLFAVLYFNLTDENGIEELSWFLGHEYLEMTFHYAEQNPTSEWMDEAVISIAKRASNINNCLKVDDEIAKVIEVAREKSVKLNLQLESVIYQAINDRIKETGEEVHFERADDGQNIYFYFTEVCN